MNKEKEIIQKREISKFFKEIKVTQHRSNFKPLVLSNSELNFIDTSSSNFKQITYHSIKQ